MWELVSEVANEKTGEERVVANKVAEYETRGGFGLAVDVVSIFSRPSPRSGRSPECNTTVVLTTT